MIEQLHFKCIITGPSFVGKSALLLQYCENEFSNSLDSTIGCEFQVKHVEIDTTHRVKLEIWDTAGQESFRAITNNYYRGAHVALLVYDISMRQTFQTIRYWLEEIRNMSGEDTAIVLVGNKCDCADQKRMVTMEEAQMFAKEHSIPFFETSAKDNTNVEQAFTCAVRQVIQWINEGKLVVVNKRPQSLIPPEKDSSTDGAGKKCCK
ncbi:hypothetical protein SAMD00019534_057130 [Acytostelium subglobosum LB1]|uniref:hypothetical protein n=1 Tax=Acytostelium subglobosum LB1 TaxID=1410327 RepID=UPI000645180A|nr:hypothetical protein SAMD00019534_057130 [Acytostelium subglobosum LB1]GAM22538.1 hypothetical protein SAMD00019534_057130 [Acytostelium subglobosum LB1]|eukprot:XP_012754658.1 hypothetical protein SAMD00019534_057130 [Acytostelium subglobosum LB1]